jgi:hypothetical protein
LILWFTATTKYVCQLEKVVLSKRMLFLCVAVKLVPEDKRPSRYTNIMSGNRMVVGRCTGCVYRVQERGKTAGFCEQGDKTSGYTQCGEFLDQFRND